MRGAEGGQGLRSPRKGRRDGEKNSVCETVGRGKNRNNITLFLYNISSVGKWKSWGATKGMGRRSWKGHERQDVQASILHPPPPPPHLPHHLCFNSRPSERFSCHSLSCNISTTSASISSEVPNTEKLMKA